MEVSKYRIVICCYTWSTPREVILTTLFRRSAECVYDDGRKYKGEWKDGMAHGKGVETDHDGTIVHKGQWLNDEPDVFRGDTAPVISDDSEVDEIDEQHLLKPVVNIVAWDARGRKGIFRGMLLNDVPHNVGHMVYDSGDVASFQGFWDYGDWQKGRNEYRNGDVYDGDFHNNVRSGEGRYEWADGRQYHGGWKADMREGQGKFLFPNGDVFEGHFVAGKRHGLGRFECHDNSLFEGSFKKGEFHGHGCKYVHRDGRVYLGDFSEGARHGYGKELYPDGTLRYEGEWNHDEPLNSGKIQPPPEGFVLVDGDEDLPLNDVPSTSKEASPAPSIYIQTRDCKTVVEEKLKDAAGNEGKFTGLILNGLPHGVGRMVYSCEIREGFWKHGHLDGHARAFFQSGDFYDGMFCNSVREGKGVYKWSDGRVYEGDYVNDQRHGHGHFVYPNGDHYVGSYANGMRSGRGKFTFSDGSSYNGEWQDSKYHGYGELKEINESYYKGDWKHGMKHGRGKEYEAEDSLLLVGEWEEGELIKKIDVSEEEVTEKVADPPVESAIVEQADLHWGLLDGENRRWESLETQIVGDEVVVDSRNIELSATEVVHVKHADLDADDVPMNDNATYEEVDNSLVNNSKTAALANSDEHHDTGAAVSLQAPDVVHEIVDLSASQATREGIEIEQHDLLVGG